MLASKLLEIILKYRHGIDDIRSLLHVPYLEQQTFPQIPRPDSGRVEFLDDLQHIQHFLPVGLYPGPEGYIVHKTLDVPAQIAVIIQTADDKRRHLVLMFGKISEPELVHQALRKTLLYGKGIVLRTFILAVVVDSQLIARNRVVFLVFREGHLPRCILFIFLPLLGNIFVQYGILFEFLTYPLLEFLGRQFYQLYRLYLQR